MGGILAHAMAPHKKRRADTGQCIAIQPKTDLVVV